ncbi:MoaD/ThiS family protein [Acinetobacter nectaris]|uniref:MoaD/ThiS family protein n=1 Tax=Acinetobacter nectaris TaxID=1219382 RepID=UPI001F185B54|nr:MoaD/ThiS family protein [Acinetobacter nectaris]MCF8999186.1 MoaD/ThiS family protein [Acinetobacter nectaris]MCF9026489.1 MoaD/ThiS family protein [Acinetobacter nectaris]
MEKITVMIESYGMIKTVLPSTLNIECNHGSDVNSILQKIVRDHANSAPFLEQCACAIGDDMVSRQAQLYTDSTLVLLSPVAGG